MDLVIRFVEDVSDKTRVEGEEKPGWDYGGMDRYNAVD